LTTSARDAGCEELTPAGGDHRVGSRRLAAVRGEDERLGFTVYETLRYREALAPLVEEEVRTLLDRLAGEVDVDRAAEIIASGAQPLRDLIGAMHSKLLLAELKRQRK
jgi:hypothetical protein